MKIGEINEADSLVLKAIEEFKEKFIKSKGLVLTESDAHCYLYKSLFEVGFGKIEPSADPEIMTNYIHSELSWYDDNRKLTIKPDITIISPKHISLIRNLNFIARIPSKQYSFSGNAIVIEIKYIRNRSEITQSKLQLIKKDITKVESLINRIDHSSFDYQIKGFILVLCKYAVNESPVMEISITENIKLIFISTNFPLY